MASLNLLDIGFAVIILLFLAKGSLRGLFLELLGLVGLLIAAWLAQNYYLLLLPTVEKNMAASNFIRNSVAYVAAFTLVLFVWSILSKIIFKYSQFSLNPYLDHLFGGILGTAKGLLVTAYALAVLHWLVPNSPFLTDSLFNTQLDPLIRASTHILPHFS